MDTESTQSLGDASITKHVNKPMHDAHVENGGAKLIILTMSKSRLSLGYSKFVWDALVRLQMSRRPFMDMTRMR